MNNPVRSLRVMLAVATLSWLIAPIAKAQCGSEQKAGLASDFKVRLKPYLELRKEAESGLPALAATDNASKLEARRHAWADRIRAARGDARQGDIFDAPIRDCLVPIVRRSLQMRTAKEAIKEGNPAHEGPTPKVAVNGHYQSEAPLSTMPPRLLTELPELPKGLEYRFIGSNLILYDADTCLIIDFIPGAGG